ncbi:50S ribosomal protein L7/L12 [candidate division WWE3 bacterium RIFCSPLOWO2_01_FULL_53_14]|uniref:Large ribosomal subunit protein bL12 n=1 Tax=candidate division WWE3 bacterium RIFCSPLOWO2_01_FULL_53_14 TaxID=1802628 RepID=A0A1F4VZ76_UNCKA|nr:MAG: 50S ribosomal protein L7/L12 [candidate division WWE3 bacterium RIFCSPLOWO2_01_FULL_53_14]
MVEEKKEKKSEIKLSKKAEEILKSVEEMSVLELNELVKALEDKFGVSSAPVAMAAPAAGAAPAGGEAAPAEEKAAYDVVLTGSGENKISVIKALREINQNLGLAEAKGLADNPGKAILEGAKKEDAEAAKKKLTEAGATVELK